MKLRLPRFGPPLLVLLVGVAGFFALLLSRPSAERRPDVDTRRLVRTLRVFPSDERLVVRATGSVTARTESDLVPEVSGRVSWISPTGPRRCRCCKRSPLWARGNSCERFTTPSQSVGARSHRCCRR